jgi:hypothetical protein
LDVAFDLNDKENYYRLLNSALNDVKCGVAEKKVF